MSSFSNPFGSPFQTTSSFTYGLAGGQPGSMTPGQMFEAGRARHNETEAQRQARESQMAFQDLMGGFSPQTLMQRGAAGQLGGHHLLGAVALDDLAARQAEQMNYGNVMDAANRIRGAAESGASAVQTAGVADLARMRQMGEEAIGLADKGFVDLQKQMGDAMSRYDRDYAQARGDQQRAISEFGQAMEAQQSAVSQAVAQQQAERRDQLAAQMGGAIPGTEGQFQEASRQMQAEADRLKFKSLTDISVEKERTTAGLQQTLAGMQQRSAEFRSGLGQTGAQMGYQARMGQQQARQLAAGLYQASAQQQAQAAQAAAQLRLSGQNTAANYILARPFSPVSLLQTMITAMNAQRNVGRSQFGVASGVSAPMAGAQFGGGGMGAAPRRSRSSPAGGAAASPAAPSPVGGGGTGLMGEADARRLFGNTGAFDPGAEEYRARQEFLRGRGFYQS